MRLIVIPDSFKGTMTAVEVCDVITEALRCSCPDAQITAIPMADGGEGTCEAFRYALGGELVSCVVSGPHAANPNINDPKLKQKEACYWRKDKTAVVELAAAAGFIQEPELRNPAMTTTYGVGELIRHAILNGCDKIILALGGSCTNDAGLGIAAALGARFLDENGNSFIPTGGTIERIKHMDLGQLNQTIRGVRFEAMCDVNNPLYGENGAAYVFAPQKGADPEMVRDLDRGLRCFADLVRQEQMNGNLISQEQMNGNLIWQDLGTCQTQQNLDAKAGHSPAEKQLVDLPALPGGGAAGGAGAGAFLFLGAKLRPGAQIILEMNRFDELVKDADLVITGEGRLDEQSLRGKVIQVVADHAKTAHVPVVAVVGATAGDFRAIYGYGVKKVVRAIDFCGDPEHYERTCREDLRQAASTLLETE